MKPSERGAALLTVLLLVALLAVMAAASLDRLHLAVRLLGNAAAIDQARSYGRAAELIAIRRIGATLQADPARVTLQGDWEGRETPLPVDQGEARATLTDAGNCFNLNSLVTGGLDGGQLSANPPAIQAFVRLMVLLEVPLPRAQQVAVAASDWIDSDAVPQPGGVEDSYYLGLPTPYRTANTLMADASELRAVAGVTPELYTRLRPYLCALPVPETSFININTIAPGKSALIAMLVPGLDPARAATAIAKRPSAGWPDLERFTSLPELAQGGELYKLQTTTRWFGLRLRITLADAEFEETALIDAVERPGKLVRRVYGEPT